MEKRRHFAALSVFSAAVLGVFTSYHAVIQPGTDRFKTVKPFCREAVKIIPPGEKVSYMGDFNTELIFFIDRPYVNDVRGGGSRFLMMPPAYAATFAAKHPGVWSERLRTVKDHQYPVVLLEKTK